MVVYFDFPGGPWPAAPENNTLRVFKRTVTNVADGAWLYTARVTAMDGFKVSVKPHRLVFRGKGEKQSFTVRIVRHMSLGDLELIHGSLGWVDAQGKHLVRSPIVITTHSLPSGD